MKKLLSVILAAAVVLAAGCSDAKAPTSAETSAADAGAAAHETAESALDNSESTPENNESTPDNSENTPESNESTPDNSESTPDYSSLSEEEIYDLMVERSLITTGDMTRMANVLKKARDGGEITVAYIGGSITYGMTVAPAEPEKCWAYRSTEWLRGQFPEATVNYVNAGISGTPSILGNARLERDVLAYDPDIVFVEFAVNDGKSSEYQTAYDSLVRTLLTQEKDIAVVLLFTVIESGHTCQEHMSKVGEQYGLPMISEPNSLGVEFADGRMTWQDYSDDESHPNEAGHIMVTDFVTHYFEQVIADIDGSCGTVDKELPEPVFSDRYMNMHYFDGGYENAPDFELDKMQPASGHENFPNGWSYKGEEEASMTFTLKCSALEMIYKANNSKLYADADIYIDGVKTCTVSSNRSDGWSNPVTQMIIDNDESAEHTVSIVVPAGDKHYFEVMGFAYTD
ncbi:MAG: SGNH/GDSL hydrolase family protein [Oscillospiraceae bacterium]